MKDVKQIANEIVMLTDRPNWHPTAPLIDAITAALQTERDRANSHKENIERSLAEWTNELRTRAEEAEHVTNDWKACSECYKVSRDEASARATKAEKHLRDANRGAERNAWVSVELARKLNEATEKLKQAESDANYWRLQATQFEENAKTFISRANELERELAEAVEALKPFAIQARQEGLRGVRAMSYQIVGGVITVGHCRRAAEIVAKHEKK